VRRVDVLHPLEHGHRVLEGVGEVFERLEHLVRALQEHLGRAVIGAVVVVEGHAAGDAAEELSGDGVVALEVVAVVGRDDLVERLLLGQAVVLELDEEVALPHHVREASERASPSLLALEEDLLRDPAAHARRRRDEARAVLLEELQIDARRAVVHAVDPAEAHDAREVRVALHVLREEHEVRVRARRRVLARAGDEVDLAADDRLDARVLARADELQRAVHVRVVGERDGLLSERRSALRELLQPDRTVQHRELGVDVEMDELCRHRPAKVHRSEHARPHVHPRAQSRRPGAKRAARARFRRPVLRARGALARNRALSPDPPSVLVS
jgi:hypothetical protein